MGTDAADPAVERGARAARALLEEVALSRSPLSARGARLAPALVVLLLARTAAAQVDDGSAAPVRQDECPPYSLGCFLDGRGTWRSSHAAYDALVTPRERHYLRAAVEVVLFVGGGTIWYYFGHAENGPYVRPPWRMRFTQEVVRLDTNSFGINFVGHPLSGAAYYAFPRANGLGVLASAGYAFGASFLWEYVAELQAKISLNDLITTPMAGIALGEFFSRLARYVNRAPGGGGKAHRALGWTIGVSQAMHDAMDGTPDVPAGAPSDALGFDASIAHRFEWRAGAAMARANGGEAFPLGEVILDGRLVAIPGHLRPGRFRGYFGDANVTRMRMRVSAGDAGHGFAMDADTFVLGVHAQRIRRRGSGVHGAALVAGTSVGYGYRRDAYDAFEDRIGATRLPGLALDVDGVFGRTALYVGARAHGDFAGIHSAPFAEWQARNPGLRTKSILEREGYYYGWGFSESAVLRVELPFLALEGSVLHARYASQDGLDRDQEELTIDVEASDRVLDAELLLRFRLARRRAFYLELGVARHARHSRLADLTLDRSLETASARIGQVF